MNALHFNTAGPNKDYLHYGIAPLSRINLPELLRFIADERYFVLHAPRQTGKTTCMMALRDHLNASGQYLAVLVNVEPAQAMRENVEAAMAAICYLISSEFTYLTGAALSNDLSSAPLSVRLTGLLRAIAQASELPVVLFLDEVDSLVGDSLISLLRQIRAGYPDRPQRFPQSVILFGVRDVRDYRMTLPSGEVITGGSAFNIKAESLRLGDFSRAEMAALYDQHTAATGQVFDAQAREVAWESTQGQPWLVNALAEQAVWKTPANLDRTQVIDFERMRAAREALILRNDTHLDQLHDKLREPRVRHVIEPMLLGENVDQHEQNRQYVLDLGLVRLGPQKNLIPKNSIYAEVLPRALSAGVQLNIHSDYIRPDWQDAQGRMLPKTFLRNFQDWWRQHGEVMRSSVSYHEAAPHLILMAYLQRVVNGDGYISREYAAGSGRLDLMVEHGGVKMAIEVKVWRDKQADPLIEGLQQIERYLDRLQLESGFLVLFDRRSSAPEWAERMSWLETTTASGKAVSVLRA